MTVQKINEIMLGKKYKKKKKWKREKKKEEQERNTGQSGKGEGFHWVFTNDCL